MRQQVAPLRRLANGPLALPAAVAALAAAAIGIYARTIEPYRPVVQHRIVPLARLPAALDGLTILHLSDFHFRADRARHAEMVRRAIAGIPADLAVLTGDFVESTEDIPTCVRTLAPVWARHGIYAVLGNHDHPPRRLIRRLFRRLQAHHGQAGMLVQALESLGIAVLINRHRCLPINGESVWLVGVDDPTLERDNLDRAMAGVPDGVFTVLLAHSPDILTEARRRRIDLTVAGHTHGGQVRLPLLGPLTTNTRLRLQHSAGLTVFDGRAMHVSAGLGASTMLRFLTPPEVVVLELRRAPQPR